MLSLAGPIVAGALLANGRRAAAEPWPKRGLAANDGVPIWQFGGRWADQASGVNWQYNWDSTTDQKQDFAEYVPMLWGTQSFHTEHWAADAQRWIDAGGSGHLLAFNEPDRADQAALDVAAAVRAWWQHMEPFAGRARLGAPAVSAAGLDWLQAFLDQCGGCHVDFVPVHWYGGAAYEHEFERFVDRVCEMSRGRKVWVTEFEGSGSAEEQSQFIRKALPFLDNNDCVYRYSYFGTADNSKTLLDGGGPGLSGLGVQYTFSPFGNGDGPR
ncbi:Glycoside superfamily [Cordyceps militaris]|uniref:Glycoside superfamily n=1 Tax=Cordyceps militaris TaxID=73501 RepID=A0A2H4SA27_CORMI|nr:Glycoside superfamily [Cordyceps militaris]